LNLAKEIKTNRNETVNTLYLVILQGLNYLVPLLAFPYLMKVLGAGMFGQISFALSICQYFIIIVDFGFNLSATKQIALAKGDKEELNRIFSSTLYAKLGLLAISFILMSIILAIPKLSIYRGATYVMSLMVVANTFSFIWLFQGLGKIRWVSIINTVAKISILPLVFIFVKYPDDYLIAAVIQSSVYVCASVVTIIVILNKHWVKLIPFKASDALLQLKDSFPIFLSTAATSIYTSCFIIILGYFSTEEAVGQYGAVEKLMRAGVCIILVPVLQAFYPKISEMSTHNKREALHLIKILALLVVICMAVIGAALFFGSPLFIKFLGNDYESAGTLFKLFALAPVMIGTGGVAAQLVLLALGGDKEKRQYQNVYLIAGVVALISVIALTPLLGAVGTTLSLLLTELCVCILMICYSISFIKRLCGNI